MPDISENTPATLDAELSASRTETVAISEADFTESVRMAEEIGKVKMAQAISSGLSLSVIRWFSSMKESGAYKGKLLIAPDGNTFRPENFEKFCVGMGFSRETIDEHLRNFATLGERYLSEAQELGLKVRDLRKVRKALKDAPEETKQEVFAALRGAKDSSEDLKTALDVVCAQLTAAKTETKKLAVQAEKLKKAGEDLRKDYDARGQVMEAQAAKYDELNEKYIRATSPHPSDREERADALKDSLAMESFLQEIYGHSQDVSWDGHTFNIAEGGEVTLQKESGETVASRNEPGSVAAGLEAGLYIRKMKVTITDENAMEWSAVIDQDFRFRLQTPAVEKAKDADPDAVLLEKLYLLQLAVGAVHELFRSRWG